MCKSSPPPAPTVGMRCLVSSRNMREATVAGEQGAKGQIINHTGGEGKGQVHIIL